MIHTRKRKRLQRIHDFLHLQGGRSVALDLQQITIPSERLNQRFKDDATLGMALQVCAEELVPIQSEGSGGASEP